MTQQQPQQQTQQRPLHFQIGTPGSAARYVKILVYGPYGAGKTWFVASAADVPEMQDVLFIEAEAGKETLINFWPDLPRIEISTYSQMARIYEFLKRHCMYRDLMSPQGPISQEEADGLLLELEQRVTPGISQPHHFRTVIIDSLSEVQKYCMYHILGVQIGKQPLDMEPPTAEFKQWGQDSEMMRLLVRSLRDLPMHVLFACQGQELEGVGKRTVYRPSLPGKLVIEVPGFLDMVGFLFPSDPDDQGTVHRRLHLQQNALFAAKNRFSAIKAPYIDDPTVGKLATAAGLIKANGRGER